MLPGDTGYLLNGLKIIINPLCAGKPKMQLSEKVPVTPEFRAEINAWMVSFFGKEPDKILMVGPHSIAMTEATLKQLRATLK